MAEISADYREDGEELRFSLAYDAALAMFALGIQQGQGQWTFREIEPEELNQLERAVALAQEDRAQALAPASPPGASEDGGNGGPLAGDDVPIPFDSFG